MLSWCDIVKQYRITSLCLHDFDGPRAINSKHQVLPHIHHTFTHAHIRTFVFIVGYIKYAKNERATQIMHDIFIHGNFVLPGTSSSERGYVCM